MVDPAPLDFEGRLDYALQCHELDNAGFARLVDPTKGQQIVRNWRARGRIGSPSFPRVREILTRASVEWINDGIGPAPRPAYDFLPERYREAPHGGQLSTGSSTEKTATAHKPESAGEIAPGYVRFPLLDGFVAAGDGGYVADYPEVVQEIDVAEDWVRRNIAAPAERVRVITAQGDSMQPDIGSGDVLFVDSGVTWFDSDAVYVMNWRGRPIVKRLQLRRDGRLLIKSTNPAYEPEEVPAGEVDQLHISGRVVGVWQFRKY